MGPGFSACSSTAVIRSRKLMAYFAGFVSCDVAVLIIIGIVFIFVR